jgi:hypothetical protein
MQYDPVRRKTVLVGCEGFPQDTSPSETWFWDGSDWSLVADATASPPGAAGGGMTFDIARGELVLLTMGSMLTWTFDGTSWTQRQTANQPPGGLWVFDLAYDPVARLTVFFGGEIPGEPAPEYPRDTWVWDGTNWKQLAVANQPPPDIDYALTYFPERDGLVMHGGWGPGGGWGFRTNVWLLTIEAAVPSVIRITDLRLLGADVSLTSTGYVTLDTAQVLQATANANSAATWVNVKTNPVPANTNVWTVPRQGDRQFFRIQEGGLRR